MIIVKFHYSNKMVVYKIVCVVVVSLTQHVILNNTIQTIHERTHPEGQCLHIKVSIVNTKKLYMIEKGYQIGPCYQRNIWKLPSSINVALNEEAQVDICLPNL